MLVTLHVVTCRVNVSHALTKLRFIEQSPPGGCRRGFGLSASTGSGVGSRRLTGTPDTFFPSFYFVLYTFAFYQFSSTQSELRLA